MMEKETLALLKNKDLCIEKAKRLMENQQYQDAYILLKKQLLIDKADEKLLLMAIECLIEMKRFDLTEKYIRQVKSNDNKTYRYFLSAKIAYGMGEFFKAMIILEGIWKNEQAGLPFEGRFFISQLLALTYHCTGNVRSSMHYFLLASQSAAKEADRCNMFSNYLLKSNYLSEITNEQLFVMHKSYNDLFSDHSRYTHQMEAEKTKLHIAYISPDFREHIMVFFSYQLLARYNRQKFKVTCYSRGKEDFVTEQLKELVDCWRDISKLNYDEAAALIAQDEIDILVDLAGHTSWSSLPILARKPAPVQISGLGYINTTGLKSIDYFLTDIYCDPIGQNDEYFTENLLRLPRSHFCYTAPDNMPDCNHGGKNGQIVFGSFNNFAKITVEMLRVWYQIIRQIPGAKLILKTPHFDIRYDVQKIYRQAKKIGFTDAQLEMRPATEAYLAEYNDIDIALDTFPYQGGGTTIAALYMGVPVISLAGTRHSTRFGYSILKNLGLDECIAHSEQEYIDKAVALSKHKEKLNYLHENLRELIRNSPLMDGAAYTNDVENIYQKIWCEFNRKKKIEDLKILAARYIAEQNFHAAMQAAAEILQLESNHCVALHIFAVCYMQLERYEESIGVVNQIVELEPSYIGAYMVLAYIYKRRNQLKEEIELLQFIVTFLGGKKGNEVSRQEVQHYSEAYSLLGSAYTLIGDIKQAQASFLLSSRIDQEPAQKIIDYSNYLFSSNYDLHITHQEMFDIHKRYNDFFLEVKRYLHGQRGLNQKIHIGYISPDFRKHAVVYFSYALLADFNKDDFTVTCYALGGEDALSVELKNLVSNWRNIRGLPADEAARIIYEDEVDILVDLSGHTAHNALPILARKPAPVQVSGIGYFNTTGLNDVDYFLTDVYCDPVGQNDAYFIEQLIRLPHSHFCYTPYGNIPECADAPCLKNFFITFGSFNNFSKVTEKTLQLWQAILARVPNAKLVLKSRVFASEFGRETAVKRLQAAGINEKKVEFRLFTAEYLLEYHDIDIALDTYPYPGGATTCEALYMGVPVISLTGNRHGARFGYSLLKNAGLEELIAENETEYIEKAVALASDREFLQVMRKNLRAIMQKSSLMNAKQYLDEVESVYKEIWRKEQEKHYPLVSVLIPTYNRPQYFQIALESAIQQTYPNIEIIVCDNSTDNRTELLVQNYKEDPRIRYVRNRNAKTKEENFQPFENLAKGEYLQWLMDDDVLKDCKIERMMQCFQENQDVTLVTSCRRWIDGEGKKIPDMAALKFDEACAIIDGRVLGKNILMNMTNLIGEPSAFLFKKKDLLHHYWNADCRGYKTISDVAMGLELLEKGKCGYFSEELSAYRRHSEQEGQQWDVVVLSRLEWIRISGEYYAKRCFLENSREYADCLRKWLDDAKHILNIVATTGLKNEQLAMEYKNTVEQIMKYFGGVAELDRQELIETKLAQGDFEGMIPLLKELLMEQPNDCKLLSKLVGAYIECNKVNEAEIAVSELKGLQPDDLFASFLQARVQYMKGNLAEVIAILESNIFVMSDDGEDGVKSLIYNLLANTYGVLGICEKSTVYYLKASRCSITVADKAIDYSNYLFHLNYLPEISRQELYRAHVGYNDIFQGSKAYVHSVKNSVGKKIRVGYISADFREHVVTFFSYALFSGYDKEKFTVICFSCGREDEVSRRIQALIDGWVNIKGMNADRAAEIIVEQNIDILVDLSGHTKNNCLPIMARKPAPIQLSGIGYFNTTGLKTIDYFLTDLYCDPVGRNDEYFSEKLLRLPHSHFCYTSLHQNIPVLAMLPRLRNGYVTFGSFNNFTKVNDDVLKTWRDILAQLPESKLILKSSIFSNPHGCEVIKKRLKKLELPLSRIAFRGETYPYLQEYNDIDIALDPFPYPGGGTTCDALFMGVPVITLIGQRHGARFGYSILKNVGLEELAARNIEEYVHVAVSLAQDIELLNVLRKNLRMMMQNSSLMNTKQYMHEVEAAYQEIYPMANRV